MAAELSRELIAEVADAAGRLGLDVADIAGAVDSVGGTIRAQSDAFERLNQANGEMVARTASIARAAASAQGSAEQSSSEIGTAREAAGKVTALFETAQAQGELSLSDLFDEAYRPIAGTNPEQVMARFTNLTDRVLPAVQEAVLEIDPRIVFCVAIDRNGYLPTHNRKFSQPQGADPVWNQANCRNRRFFNDRVGLGAGRNTKPFLLQTYRRDMGGGAFMLMKDVSAPVRIGGRHWGGVRIGYKA